MAKNSLALSTDNLKSRIYTIRNMQVMLDSDLAELYDVETKALNRGVKRNIERFPENFMFQLTESEYNSLRCQFGTSMYKPLNPQKEASEADFIPLIECSNFIDKGGRRYLPYVFTEQGVAMLSGVLKSKTAIDQFRLNWQYWVKP